MTYHLAYLTKIGENPPSGGLPVGIGPTRQKAAKHAAQTISIAGIAAADDQLVFEEREFLTEFEAAKIKYSIDNAVHHYDGR